MEMNRKKYLKILTLLLVLVVSVFSMNSIGAEGESKKVTFTVNTDEAIYNYRDKLKVDLFKIGSISFDHNKYIVSFDDDFKNMESIKDVDFNNIDLTKLDDASIMSAITNEVSSIIEGLTRNADYSNKSINGSEDIMVSPNTVFIAFPHNDGIDKSEYLKKTSDYFSVATFEGNDFRFTPNLIFVVQEDLPVTIKATTLANLEIKKELESYAGDPVTFVFKVIDESDKDEFDNGKVIAVASLSFDNYGIKTTIVKDIPVGHTITVTEAYTGASYKIDGDKSVTIGAITSTGKNGATFKNNNDNDKTKGNGVDNKFEYQQKENGQYEWKFKERTIIDNGVVKTETAGGVNG